MKQFTINKNIIVLQSDAMQNNTIIYTSNDSVFVIDPSFDSKAIFDKYKKINNRVVVLTHCHYDHIGNINELNKFANKIIISSKFKKVKNCVSKEIFFDTNLLNWDKVVFVNDKENYEDITFFHTPGHSIDSMCILIDKVLLSGDHVFSNCIGRTDLDTSDSKMMLDSLRYFKNIIINNGVELIIHGHTNLSQADELLESNPYLIV